MEAQTHKLEDEDYKEQPYCDLHLFDQGEANHEACFHGDACKINKACSTACGAADSMIFFIASLAPPLTAPSVRELSEAVASVNDWRAMGIFLFAVMVVQLIGAAWGRRQERIGAEADRRELVAALDKLTERLTTISNATMIHQARTESVLSRVERDQLERGR